MRTPNDSDAPARVGRTTLLWAGAVTAALWFVPGAGRALYPLRLFVTFVHEGGHALAALLTGGRVDGIVIQPDASGYTLTQGGWEMLVVTAGYLGATLYGAGVIALGRRPAWARPALGVSAAWVGLLSVLFVRPWVNPFGFAWGAALAAGLGWAAWKLPARGAERLAMFLGVQCALNALSDLWTLVGLSATVGGGPATDAALMARMVPLPPLVWALLWGAAALGILAASLRPYWREGVRS